MATFRRSTCIWSLIGACLLLPLAACGAAGAARPRAGDGRRSEQRHRAGRDGHAGGARAGDAGRDASRRSRPTTRAMAIVENVTPGPLQHPRRVSRASISACCATSALRAGDNKHVVVLPLTKLEDSVDRRTGHAGGGRRPAHVRVRPGAVARIRSTRSRTIPPETAAADRRARRPRRHRPRRQLRRAAAAAEGADQVDPRHARSVRRRSGAARAARSSTSSRSRASARCAASFNFAFRDGSMTGKSQFTPTPRAGAVQELRRQHRRHARQGQDQLQRCR